MIVISKECGKEAQRLYENMNCTYLLLHPSSNIIIDYIFETLNKKGLQVKAVYKILRWDEILDDIYKNTYPKSSSIKTHVHAHAFINKYMFGNCGLILILYKNITYTELVKQTLEVKRAIRMFVDKTKNGTISIFCSTDELKQNMSNAQKHKESNILPETINVFFSYLHCPDTIEQYEEDFKVLSKYMINQLSLQEIEGVLKYRSYF